MLVGRKAVRIKRALVLAAVVELRIAQGAPCVSWPSCGESTSSILLIFELCAIPVHGFVRENIVSVGPAMVIFELTDTTTRLMVRNKR